MSKISLHEYERILKHTNSYMNTEHDLFETNEDTKRK